MANAAGYKVHDQFSNELKIVRMVYDFSVDGGAQGALSLGELDGPCVIVDGWTSVKTQCTSGGSATVIVGVNGGDTDAILASTAVASLTANAIFPLDAAGDGEYLADGAKVDITIGTAALTAGKIEVCLVIAKFNG